MANVDTVVIFGILISVVGASWLMCEAFRVHPLWVVCCFFVPLGLGVLSFIVLHWSKAWKPFLVYFVGSVLWVGWLVMNVSPPPRPAAARYEALPAAADPHEEAPKVRSGNAPAKKTRRVRTWQQVPTE